MTLSSFTDSMRDHSSKMEFAILPAWARRRIHWRPCAFGPNCDEINHRKSTLVHGQEATNASADNDRRDDKCVHYNREENEVNHRDDHEGDIAASSLA